jgi:hypothetical protein
MASKCPICNKQILQTQKIVRIVVEAVDRGKDDGADYEYWTHVLDWETCSLMHLACVCNGFDKGMEIPYHEECRKLPVEELLEKASMSRPKLRIVS